MLQGEATFLLQKRGEQIGVVDDAIVVTAHVGDKLIITPGYGHVAINTGCEPMVMGRLVAANFCPVHCEYRAARGAAYYLLHEGSEAWVRNPRYSSVPTLRREIVRAYKELGLGREHSLYELLHTHPERLLFLTRPEEFPW